MASSTLIVDYVGRGTFAARPATPNIPAGATAIYMATDTGNSYIWNGTVWALIAGTVVGTVSSVAATVPGEFAIAGSPITTTGTLSITWATQTANKVLASATSGGAATPAFRALVAADLPATAVTPGSYTATNLTVDAAGRITAAASMTTITSAANYDTLVYDSGTSKWLNQRAKYIIAASIAGVLANSMQILYHRFSKAVTIPANFGAYLGHASQAGGTANATASTVIVVEKAATATPNTFAAAGTITIAAGSVTSTFASTGGTAVVFVQGDVLRIMGPATADATFAGFYATLVGFET